MEKDTKGENISGVHDIPFENFTSYRNGQEEIIEKALELLEYKKIIVINAAVGVGKSLCAMMICSKFKPSVYTCTTKILQAQLKESFPEAMLLKGRSNYPCPRFAEWDASLTAENCQKQGCANFAGGDCPYEIAKADAISARYRILNLSYLLTEANFSANPNFSNQDLIVIDEADNLEQQLVDFITLTLTAGNLRFLSSYGLGCPEFKTKHDSWVEWAKKCAEVLATQMNKMSPEVSIANPNPELLKKFNGMKRLSGKIQIFIECSTDKWLRYETEDGKMIFRPIWLTPELTQKYLLRHCNKLVLMSATFPPLPVLCRVLGIDEGEVGYIEAPCPFPIENRMVYFDDVADLSYKNFNANIHLAIDRVKEILAKHKGQKGIIHATSYELVKRVMAIGDRRLITHDSKNKEEVVNRFKESKEDLVLVSPSSEKGLSLDDDLARFGIWVKVPFPNVADKVVAARLYGSDFGKTWYKTDAAQKIVQGTGRSVRHMEDHSTNYILDSQFSRILSTPKALPKWFVDALVV